MKINIPDKVEYIINKLNEHGYSAFAVGGCIRDTLINRLPGDWDITTSAKPLQIKKQFDKTIDTGLEHGTVTVVLRGEAYEVTTFRIDGEYEDNRRPKYVEFTEDLIEDLKRRDFTINAMAYNNQVGIVDAFNGKEDLNNKIIRCVGTPENRFKEDALRMLRAVRFSAQLNFNIHDDTKIAIINQSELIKNISAERIQIELTKLIISDYPKKFNQLKELSLLNFIIPEFDLCYSTTQNNPYHKYNVAQHSLEALANIESDKILRWTLLLHDIGKPIVKTTDNRGIDHFHRHSEEGCIIAKRVLKRLKMDNRTIDFVTRLIKYHDMHIETNDRSVRKAINKVGQDIFPMLLKVKKADLLAHSEYKKEENLLTVQEVEKIYNKILEKKECYSLKQLEINGEDVIKLGVKQGKEVGEVLKYLLELVIDKPDLNKNSILNDLVKDYINSKNN